jgi:hypothetical protein
MKVMCPIPYVMCLPSFPSLNPTPPPFTHSHRPFRFSPPRIPSAPFLAFPVFSTHGAVEPRRQGSVLPARYKARASPIPFFPSFLHSTPPSDQPAAYSRMVVSMLWGPSALSRACFGVCVLGQMYSFSGDVVAGRGLPFAVLLFGEDAECSVLNASCQC